METLQPAAVTARSRMERTLGLFFTRAVTDAALNEYAAHNSVGSYYVVSDLGLEFYLGFHKGRVSAGLGAPPWPVDVTIRAKEETLDGILSGRVNAKRAAMTAHLSFRGSVRLAWSMQQVQRDVERLYSTARSDRDSELLSEGTSESSAPSPKGN